MHLHAYTVTDVRVLPPQPERTDWEPDDVLDSTGAAATWLGEALRELCKKPELSLADETAQWLALLGAGHSVQTGARGTTLLVEQWPDCTCDQSGSARVTRIRRTRSR